jgi:hypothetical protein
MWWKGCDKPEVTLYHRDDGPVCYEVKGWATPGEVHSFVDDLLSNDLQRYWKSEYGEIGIDAPSEARVKALGLLDTSTREHFQSNAWYIDDRDNGLEILVYGFGGILPADEGSLQKAVRRFVAGQPGPLEVVIYQGCDSRTLLIYVPLSPCPAVRTILARFDASPDTAQRREYSQLWCSFEKLHVIEGSR